MICSAIRVSNDYHVPGLCVVIQELAYAIRIDVSPGFLAVGLRAPASLNGGKYSLRDRLSILTRDDSLSHARLLRCNYLRTLAVKPRVSRKVLAISNDD